MVDMARYSIGVLARAPSSPGKTRLAGHVPAPQLRALRIALLADALRVAAAVPDSDAVIFVTPEGTEAEVLALAPRPMTVVAQQGADLGDRMRHAFRVLFDRHECAAAVIVGTDAPLSTSEHVSEALALLRDRGGVVLGPADDGGYYLIGMTKPCDVLFDGIAWGGESVLAETLDVARSHHIDVALIERTYDVDRPDDLRRLEHDLASAPSNVAPNVRRYISERW